MTSNIGQAFAFTVLTKLAVDVASLKQLQKDVQDIAEHIQIKNIELPSVPGGLGGAGAGPGVAEDTGGEDEGGEGGIGGIASKISNFGKNVMGELTGGIGQVLGGIAAGTMGIFGAMSIVSAILGNQYSGLKVVLEMFGVLLQLYLKPIADLLFVLLRPVMFFMIKLLPLWYQFVSDPVGALKGILPLIGAAIGEFLGFDLIGPATALGEIFMTAGKYIQDGLTVLYPILVWIGKTVAPVLHAALQAYVQIIIWQWSTIGRAIITGFQLLYSGLSWLWATFGPSVIVGFNLLISGLSWLWDTMVPIIRAGFVVFVQLMLWMNTYVVPQVRNMLNAFVVVIQWLADNVGGLIREYVGIWLKVLQWVAAVAVPVIQSVFDALAKSMKWYIDNVHPVVTLAFASLLAVFGVIHEKASEMVSLMEEFIDAFVGLPAKLTKDLEGLGEKITNAILKMIPSGKGLISGAKGMLGVGDAIIKPSGEVINTDPADWLFATKDPDSMRKGTTQTININVPVHGLVDAQTIRKIADEIAKETRRRVII